MANKDILFLLPYPLHRAPSQRFRVENLLFLLDEAQRSYTLAPFLSESVWQILYQKGGTLKKAWGITTSYCKRLATILFKAYQYEYIFIHREAAPIGPPLIEWFLCKVLGKKVIFDFDDAIWIPNISSQNKIARWVKAFWKIQYICKWSYKVAAGNEYLCDFARKSGAKEVCLLPTVVNTQTRYNILKTHQEEDLVIGWTGSHSTLKFLDELIPLIEILQEQYSFTFLVIADKKPALRLKKWAFCPWNAANEINDLLRIDIGVMPLKQDLWSEGKCGFKLIQYLSLGIPAVANSVGVNKIIIEDNVNGFLADDKETWLNALKQLIESVTVRRQMGVLGRDKIVANYSIAAQKQTFLSLFE